MVRNTTSSFLKAARELFEQWQSLTIMIGLYAALLIVIYLCVSIKEATPAQVTITFALIVATPLLFFSLQMVIASFANTGSKQTPVFDSILNSWKLLVISLPVILATAFILFLINKLQSHFPLAIIPPANPYVAVGSSETTKPIHWATVTLTSFRYLFLGVLAPLALIQFWISASRDGLLRSLRSFLNHLIRTVDPHSLLTYLAGFLLFAVIPYLLLSKTTSTTRPWLEISLFSARLITAFCLTLFGWAVTVRAVSLGMEAAPAKKAA